MPRYFFHVTDGQAAFDHEGTELPDLKTARAEAIRTAGEILSAKDTEWAGTAWRMSVADAQGIVLLTLDFSALDHKIDPAR